MKHPRASPAVKAAFTTGLKLALAALLLAWLARSGRVDPRIFATLDGRALLWLAMAAFLQGLMIVAMAARWKCWLQVFALDASDATERARLSWRESLIITARGACVGAWTPAGLGLDGIRAAHALRRFQSPGRALPSEEPEQAQPRPPGLLSMLRGAGAGGASGAARVVGLASLLDRVAALAALLVLALPFLAAQIRERAGLAGQAGVLLFLILAALGVALTARRRKAGGVRASPGQSSHIGWGHAGWGAAWSFATHVANILALSAILEALVPGLPAWRALSLAFEVGPMIVLSGAIPLTPLGLGVADATGEALLGRHGLGCGGEAVMMVRAIWLGVCLLAGLAFWARDEVGGSST